MAFPRFSSIGAAVALVLLCACAADAATISASRCRSIFGSGQRPFLFFADPGIQSGTSENAFILKAMTSVKNISEFDDQCGAVITGKLLGFSIAVVGTGIGPLQAAGCVQKVLSCSDHIKEAIFSGTAGFPSAVGGILNPPNCSSANSNAASNLNVGALCITPFAINWDCKLADWTGQAGPGSFGATGNVCYKPAEYLGPQVTSLYGKCLFTSAPPGSVALTEELTLAAKSVANQMPRRADRLVAYEHSYWAAMSNGTGTNFSALPPNSTSVKVFDHTSCVEVDSQFFFSGAPWEFTSRDITALTLNTALNTSHYSAGNVVYANAMEGIGFLHAMESFNSGVAKKIPYTMARGMSDYTHVPVAYNATSHTWSQPDFPPTDFSLTYPYAISTYSNALLALFKARCSERRPGNAMCDYTMPAVYPL